MFADIRDPSTRRLIKAALMVILVCGSVFATVWFHYVQKTEVIFQSIFYIPIILGCLWYNRWGIILAGCFALLILILSFVSPAETPVWENAVRGSAYILTAVVVAELSVRRKALIASLEEKVEERTAELQASNEELDNFASTVSHDLVGPLATLQGFAGIAREAVSSGESELQMESLDAIDRLSMRVVHTVEGLLEHARSRKQDGLLLLVDTGTAASEVVSDLRGLMSGKEIDVAIVDDLPQVRVEAVKLKQVFTNLIGNAVKHAASGRPLLIEIGGYREGDLATLFVRDDGPGIESHQQEMIFEEFTQLSAGEQTPGLGLGLAIVKRAVEGWGGGVWLESSPGEGTTFYFTAPL
jgi:signal transduction histidine kinase